MEHGAVCEGRRETMLVEGRRVKLPTAVHLPHHKQATLGSVCVCVCVCVCVREYKERRWEMQRCILSGV